MQTSFDYLYQESLRLSSKGKYRDALKCLEKAILAVSKDDKIALYKIYLQRGMIRHKQGQYKKAIGCFSNSLLKLDGIEEGLEHSTVYELLANCHYKLKNYREAINYYNRAFKTFKGEK